MKKNIKHIILTCYDFFYNTLNSLIAIIKILLFSGFKSNINNKEIGSETDCYILGNGPSLNLDLINKTDFFLDKKILVVNEFALSDLFQLLKPRYYIFADPSYWSNNTYSEMKELRTKIFSILNKEVNWQLYIFIPFSAFKSGIFQESLKSNNNLRIEYYNTTHMYGFDFFKHFLFKTNLASPRIQNVLVAAIYNSINLGFKNIYLLGADHSWTSNIFVNSKNEVCLVDRHFYDQGEDNNRVWLDFNGEPSKMHEILQNLSATFKGYYELKFYADYLDSHIINLTTESFIDAFDRDVLKTV